jgi:hypothetical protein
VEHHYVAHEGIVKPTGNERSHANINGKVGGTALLSTIFSNQSIHKNTCTSPDWKTHKQTDATTNDV